MKIKLEVEIDTEKEQDLNTIEEVVAILKELADNTVRKDQIIKRIAEHNITADTAKLYFYKNKEYRKLL